MTLNYSAKITVDAKGKTDAIYDSVNTDNEFYPENPVKTKIKLDKKLVIFASCSFRVSFTRTSCFSITVDLVFANSIFSYNSSTSIFLLDLIKTVPACLKTESSSAIFFNSSRAFSVSAFSISRCCLWVIIDCKFC